MSRYLLFPGEEVLSGCPKKAGNAPSCLSRRDSVGELDGSLPWCVASSLPKHVDRRRDTGQTPILSFCFEKRGALSWPSSWLYTCL